MVVRRFKEVSKTLFKTAGFTHMDEETVGRLLEEDGLDVGKEEEVFEGLLVLDEGNQEQHQ